MCMKKSERGSLSPETRPVNKATMDQPQEEFIADSAGVEQDERAGADREKNVPLTGEQTKAPARESP